YTNNNEVFKITLVKVKLDNSKVFKAGVNSFMDAMVFYYDYRKNNKIILSNYDSLKKFKPTPTVGNIFNDNVFTCFGSKGENPNKLKCFIKDVPKKHGNQLHLIFNKDLNTLTSKNTSGSGGISIYFNESDKPLDGFTFPDNMTLKKVK
ncbi:MAG: hypothetical protein QM539_10720, partial [Alphaproteobacteria bacterium]|nr:hypothetical protein [Alphaproteobacteria bacterium]